MNPEEARVKMEKIASKIRYEENLIVRSNSYANSKQTAEVSKNRLKDLNKELDGLRKYL